MPAREQAVIRHGRAFVEVVHPAGNGDGVIGPFRIYDLARELPDFRAGPGVELVEGHFCDELVAFRIPREGGTCRREEEKESGERNSRGSREDAHRRSLSDSVALPKPIRNAALANGGIGC